MRVLRYFRLIRAWRSFRNAFAQMRRPEVPLHLKVFAAVLALLIVSPLNILGDIPLLGLFDDVALLGLLSGWFVGVASTYANAVTLEGELVPVDAGAALGV